LDLSLYTILQIFSVTLFEKVPILQVLTDSDYKKEPSILHKQLPLFNL
ncbi:MAG: IS4 family transposase, partial [Candidatus Brocadiaceae bacterium]|nr:IS4 family transposase [Candidatus Brocadiaceae bacterium]